MMKQNMKCGQLAIMLHLASVHNNKESSLILVHWVAYKTSVKPAEKGG